MFWVDLKLQHMQHLREVVPSTRTQVVPSSKPFKRASEDANFDPRSVGSGHRHIWDSPCPPYDLDGPTLDGYTFSRIWSLSREYTLTGKEDRRAGGCMRVWLFVAGVTRLVGPTLFCSF